MTRQYRWSEYLICIAPLSLLAYIGLESYGIDYRAFFLAGKAALNGLDPYLNHIALSSQYYGPINAELAHYSGWKYPPLATYAFMPFAKISYELSKNLFNLISIAAAVGAISIAIRLSRRRLAPESILIAGFSFPVITTIKRGQVEILLVVLASAAILLMTRGLRHWATILISLLSAIKVYPLLLAALLIRGRPGQVLRSSLVLISSLLIVALATITVTPQVWRTSFFTRVIIPFASVPGQVLPSLPSDSGVIEGSTTVRSADARNLIHSHDFVFGFANPLLTRQTALAAIIGIGGVLATLIKNHRQPLTQQALAVMPWINVANPLAWIMGITWYIPLFLYSYFRVRPLFRFVLCLPLILPPMLNVSGYLAAIISFLVAGWYNDSSPDDAPHHAT